MKLNKNKYRNLLTFFSNNKNEPATMAGLTGDGEVTSEPNHLDPYAVCSINNKNTHSSWRALISKWLLSYAGAFSLSIFNKLLKVLQAAPFDDCFYYHLPFHHSHLLTVHPRRMKSPSCDKLNNFAPHFDFFSECLIFHWFVATIDNTC